MQSADSTPAIEIKQVVKNYGSVTALSNVSFSIADREFFTLLGPSGCGKTTLLRLIAGFESITAGSIDLYGEEIAELPPNKRPVNTVFQQYSLFPHMTVAENVKFGLQMKGARAEHIEKRTRQMLELVQLSEFADRKSTQLSGGQQQRVALARALAPEPKVLLLDEPLSALDLKLRQAMRGELMRIQQETGITFVFVTHDQEEALTMSDRIAVMSDGEVQQIGSSKEVYLQPVNRFVADFIGESNILAATVTQSSVGELVCELSTGETLVCSADTTVAAGSRGSVCVRPERVQLAVPGMLHEPPHGQSQGAINPLNGQISETVYLGTDTQVGIRMSNGDQLLARIQNTGERGPELTTGQSVVVTIAQDAARFLVQ